MKKAAMAMMCLVGLELCSAAWAGGMTRLPVTARISGKCLVATGPGTLAFSTVDPSRGSSVTATQTLVLRCSNGTVSTATVDDGGSHNVAGQMQMVHSVNGAAFLPYSITYSGDAGLAGTGFGGAAGSQTVTINGIITPAHFQSAVASTGAQGYSDTVTITLNP